MTLQAQLVRMTDEELTVVKERLLPMVIAALEHSEHKDKWAFALTRKGRRAADLSSAENHRMMSILQVRLAEA